MRRGVRGMKRGLKIIAAGIAALAAGMAGLASAETVLSVTQVSYDYENHPVCTAVRMNPAIYGSLPSDACTLGTASATYGNDRITVNSYDAAGELVQVTQAYGTSDQRVYSTFSYSNNGKLIDSIDANGNRSHNVYDGFDRLATVYYPSTTRPSAYNPSSQANALATAGAYNSSDYESYSYDANDNRTSWRRRDGQTISYSYDNLNQEIVSDAPGTALDIYTNHDGLGRITYKRFGSTSGAGVSYAYDGLGRVKSATDMNGRTLSYQYNQSSTRTRLTYPDSVYIGYGLDNANRLSTMGYNAASGAYAQAYNSLGQLTSMTKGGGSTAYGYDAVGRLTSMTNDLSGTTYDVTWSFAYNPSSQIYTSTASSTVYDYKETANSTLNQTYDGLNRDAAIAAMSGGYDARGNMTSDGARGFTYDVYNRLLTATGGSAALTLTYDPEGRLASYASGSTTTQFLYDGVDLVGEYNSSGAITDRYVFGAGADDPVIWYKVSDGSQKYFYTNYQGSIIGYADAAGVLGPSHLFKYGPYGEPKDVNNTDSWSGARFAYTGQIMLPEAKLYYYKARVYDPVYGRFLQTDPVGSKDDLDLYTYTGDDPVNGTDPTGLMNTGGDEDFEQATSHYYIIGGDEGGGGTDLSGILAKMHATPESFGNRLFGDSGDEAKQIAIRQQEIVANIFLMGLTGPEEGLAEGAFASVAVSPALKFGTTEFGQVAHMEAAPIISEMLENAGAKNIETRVLPGETGVDVSYRLADSLNHIEIKPNTASGLRSFNQQVKSWVKKGVIDSASDIRAITYDAQGNLRWGFQF